MAIRAEASDLSTATAKFRAALGALGITQRRAAELFGVEPRSLRRWQSGARHVPRGIGILLNLMAAKVVTITEVEQAAAPLPTRTNGSGAKAARPAPLVAPVLEPSASAATFADPDPTPATTAQKVYAVTGCRWPHGDPGHTDFCFCDRLIARGFYCEEHHRLACLPAIDKRPSAPFRFSARTISTTRKLTAAV